MLNLIEKGSQNILIHKNKSEMRNFSENNKNSNDDDIAIGIRGALP